MQTWSRNALHPQLLAWYLCALQVLGLGEGAHALMEHPRFFASLPPLCWVQGVDINTSFILNIFEVMQIWSVTKLSFFVPAGAFALNASVQRDL